MSTRETILVTGGAGYVGSHVCKTLAGAGFVPVTYDNLCRGHRWAVKWGPFEEGDIADEARLAEVFAAHRPTAVIHMAAFAYVGESVYEPAPYYANNIGGSGHLLQAMRAADVGLMVFSSSCAVYGAPPTMPIRETVTPEPLNPYGFTKLAVERMLRECDAQNQLRSISLRYFNAAGADPDGDIGEDHDPEPHLIPSILDVAGGRRERATVFGDDYDTPDGTCIRDFIHVSDLARAHVLALENLLQGGATQSINLANGSGFSVREVIDAARDVTGADIDTAFEARRPGDPPVLVGDAGLARDVLGWEPEYPSLAEQIGHAWAWHRKHHLSR